jgi:hypothetical protein
MSCKGFLADNATSGCIRPERIRPGRTIAIVFLFFLTLTAHAVAADCVSRVASSGRWRLETRDGVSWLITPCGARFFSIGINTLVDRPPPPPPLKGVTKNPWLHIAGAPADWMHNTLKQVRAWGFNSAGAFSAPNVPLPNVSDLDLGWRARFLWDDSFDPSVEEQMMVQTEAAVASHKKDAYRIGYFSDNEVGWWSEALFGYYLKQPPTNYTKQTLVALIRRHYGRDWHRFTDDFVVLPGISSFKELLHNPNAQARLRPGGNGIAVVREWTGAITRHYYELVHRALRAADPTALIFGDRLPDYYDPDAVRAMAPFVDAVATNYDVDSPDGWIAHYYFDGLQQLTGNKPVLVSEWYFAANENRSGNSNNGHLMTVQTQAQRAEGAANAARLFALEPGTIGIHWFQYYDEPKGGRAQDHEDYNFGLVDARGRPYEKLVAALTAANRSLVELHRSAAQRRSVTQPGLIRIPEADIDVGSLSLARWPKDQALVRGVSAPSPEVAFGDLFLAWSPQGLHVATLSMDHYDGHMLAYDGEFPRTEAFRIDFGADAGAGAQRFAFFAIPPKELERKRGATMRIEVCRMNHATCAPVPSATAVRQNSGRPRILIQVTLPWKALGMSGPPADGRLRVQLAVTAFYRSRWMSLGGIPPAQAMAKLEHWRPAVLAGLPGTSSAAQ